MARGTFEEVDNREDANEVIVISQSWGKHDIISKIWFKNNNADDAALLAYVAENYPYFFGKFIRTDIYPVRLGRIFGRN